MRAIPVAVRERILALYQQNKSTRQIADALGYCQAAVRRVRQHCKERGTIEPATHLCGAKGFFTQDRQERVRQLILEKPDRTLEELCQEMDRPVAISTMDTWVRKLGFSFKKSPSTPVSKTGRMSRHGARVGIRNSQKSLRKSLSFSMNQAPRPT
jgi:transposase